LERPIDGLEFATKLSILRQTLFDEIVLGRFQGVAQVTE
jgi:hypothetical protein